MVNVFGLGVSVSSKMRYVVDLGISVPLKKMIVLGFRISVPSKTVKVLGMGVSAFSTMMNVSILRIAVPLQIMNASSLWNRRSLEHGEYFRLGRLRFYAQSTGPLTHYCRETLLHARGHPFRTAHR